MDAEIVGGTFIQSKKVVDRSAAYPSITLDEAITFSKTIAKSFPKDGATITRKDIAAILKKSEGAIQRDIATCYQYGLFTRQKEGYVVSPSLRSLVVEFDEKEKRKIYIECFKSPKLYRELIEKFDGHAVPSELAYHLIRDHEISDKAAPEAARIFIANGIFCGVLNDSSLLNVNDIAAQLQNPNFQFAEVVQDGHQEAKAGDRVVDITPKQNQQLPPHTEHQERLTIRLSGKNYAYLVYPDELTKKDIDIIRKELDVIEFRIQE